VVFAGKTAMSSSRNFTTAASGALPLPKPRSSRRLARPPRESSPPLPADRVDDLFVDAGSVAELARKRSGPTLDRVAFTTSRLAEFCSERELVAQTGQAIEEWPLVILKELIDNSLDACEEAQIAPEIDISVSAGEISVADNGPGIPVETIRNVLDFSSRVSSREAYVSPTRGAQGNALKTLFAMPFALHGKTGTTVIDAQGARHTITFKVDQLRQSPVIDHKAVPIPRRKGARICVIWPESASSVLADAEARFLQIADDFGWLNPHLRLRAEWNGAKRVNREPSNLAWEKWRACDPTSAHWYDLARLERYIAAHVNRDQDHGRERTVREFISELRGFSGSAKQKLVLDETGLTRKSLASLFGPDGEPESAQLKELLAALKAHSKAVKPKDLGLIGKDHLAARFKEVGVEAETFRYQKTLGETDSLPWIVETAFGWCPNITSRRIVVGINWGVGLGNPFRSFSRYGGEGLESLLVDQRAGRNEPIIFVLHFACPRTAYTDRGKSAIVLPGSRQ
jgi:DNA topoisomerase VI subunit B